VEPFFGSGAALLCRPQPFSGSETVNDYDGLVANFWRALQAVPDEVAHWADWPVNENDLHARHVWLVERKDPLQAKLEGDPEYYDAKIAGWWVWGMAAWIGSGFCSGKGPWGVVEEDGCRQLVHLGDAGRGVKRQLVHLGDAGRGVNRKLVHLGDAGQGVNRQLVHLGDAGQGVNRQLVELEDYFQQLADRLRHVRVCCGDWSRVMGDSVTRRHGKAAILLDPPYSHAVRDNNLYRVEDDCAAAVRKWCAANGDDKQLRIALCGYAGEGHEELEEMGWRVLAWKASGGYESQGKERTGNAAKERIWFSPHCLQVESPIVPSRVDPVRIESTRSLFDAP
jgi:DNA adenine methylase